MMEKETHARRQGFPDDTRRFLIQYAASHSLDELMVMALDTLEPLTGSCISFIHFVEPDGKTLLLQQWSTRTKTRFCEARPGNRHYPVDKAGVWADSIRCKKPVIHNDYAALPHKQGLPPGHAEVLRELVVPVLRNDRVKAILGMGNKLAPYTRADVDTLTYHADVIWEIIEKKRAEQEITFQQDIEKAMSRLAGMLLTTTSLEDISEYVLDAAKTLTKSRYGFVGTFDNHRRQFTSHTMTRDIWQECRIPDKSIVFDKFGGLWGWVLENRTPAMVNDIGADPRATGAPPGHIAITAFLGVPAMIEDEVAGLIALANPSGVYRKIDLTIVQRLATLFSMAVQRHRYETRLLAFQVQKAKFLEKRMEKSEERLKLILDSVSDAVWDWRIDTGEVYFSSRYYTMLGYRPDELPPTLDTWKALLHPEDRTMAEETVRRHLLTTEPFEMEFRLKTRQNDFRWILGRGKTVEKDAAGKALRMVGTHVDITERKKMELRLRHAQKMEAMGILAGGIAHDFNNILAGIVGYAELVKEDVPEDSRAARRVAGILSASERARDLISQILTFSRKKETVFLPMDIRAVVKEAVQFMRASLPATVTVTQDIPSLIPSANGDPSQIHQLILNLAANAAQAMNQAGTLAISLATVELDSDFTKTLPDLVPGTYIRLRVSDTGCGIPAEILPRIFDPFFTTREKGRGTGLGLATVHGIVKDHQGEITVESTPGKGTCFDVFLPASARDVKVESHETRITPGGRERLMVVDDEQVLPYIVHDMLEDLGYTVTTFTDSLEALAFFEANSLQVDLLLTDITMPKMTGIELVRACHRIRPDLPVILWSGNMTYLENGKEKVSGVSRLLHKPFKRKDLALAIRDILGNP
jgi:PAS domain S-box-containing protein